MKKQTILLLGPALENKGGMSESEKVIIENWKSEKFKLTLVATHQDGTSLAKIKVFLLAIAKYFYLLATEKPKIIYIFFSVRASFYRKAIFIILSKLFFRKIVLHARGGELGEFYKNSSYPLRIFIKFTFLLADTRLVLGNEEKKTMDIITNKFDAKIIHNSINCPEYIATKKNKPKVISTLGRISSKKGTFDLLNAIPLIIKKIPDVEFWLCGEGEEPSDMILAQKTIEQKQLKNNVKLLGWVSGEQKETVYLKSWIYVLPSHYEGMSRSILEAMSYGLPVVTTKINGTLDLVQNDVTGLLIDPGDYKGLADNIILLLNDDEKRLRMGNAGRNSVATNFNVNAKLKELEEIFCEVA